MKRGGGVDLAIVYHISHRPYICELSSVCENKPNEYFP